MFFALAYCMGADGVIQSTKIWRGAPLKEGEARFRSRVIMTRAELVVNVAGKSGLTKKDSEKAVAAVFETIKQALIEGDKVQVLGFGTFEIRPRSARKGRNPQSGEEIEIPASKLPSFKAGKALKEAVNQ